MFNMMGDVSIATAAGAVTDYGGDDNYGGSGADDNGDNGIEVARVVLQEANDNVTI